MRGFFILKAITKNFMKQFLYHNLNFALIRKFISKEEKSLSRNAIGFTKYKNCYKRTTVLQISQWLQQNYTCKWWSRNAQKKEKLLLLFYTTITYYHYCTIKSLLNDIAHLCINTSKSLRKNSN